MRILSVVRKNYYGVPTAIEPMHVYFTMPLKEMGHEVDTFDHYEMSRTLGRERATSALVDRIQREEFDVVFYQTSGQEPVETVAFADLSRRFCIAAWNSDDDWQWESTRRVAGHFSFMITTYPHIYERNRSEYPNLLLSQWACPGQFSEYGRRKDINFSFAGSIYGERNRARISYTPLEASSGGKVLQIKGRIFEMGLSGTMVLCEQSLLLERYYQPGREIVTFEGLEECAEKARWYVTHELERVRIARNYRDRTLGEHMWKHRFEDLFRQIGFPNGSTRTKREPSVGV